MDAPDFEITYEQLPDEPDLWYKRFRDYFLPQGPTRTLRRAFLLYRQTEKPELDTPVESAPPYWSEYSRTWQWFQRAEDYDRDTSNIAVENVRKAVEYLQQHALQAGETLVVALGSERLKVAAAKEILDRAGVPATTKVDLNGSLTFTADDFNKASEDVDKWEEEMKGRSGSGASSQ